VKRQDKLPPPQKDKALQRMKNYTERIEKEKYYEQK